MIESIQPRPRRVMVEPGVTRERLQEIESDLWFEYDRAELIRAGKQVAQVAAINALRPVAHTMSNAEMAALAERRADAMRDVIAQAGDVWSWPSDWLLKWANDKVSQHEGRRIRRTPGAKPDQVKRGIINRMTCATWWARSLKAAATAKREAVGRAAAQVCAKRQPYLTDETMRRAINQAASNQAMLERTELENEEGQIYTLAELSKVSVSNPAIRRGELMTRIRGCEEWAQATKMRGVFLTLTTPSRFHAVHRHGELNQKWVEAGKPTPKAGQGWLCAAWQRTRAELKRKGLGVFGFRVAEPHHDGTPHWHGLFWCKPGELWRVVRIIKRQWLKDEGQEAGARQHRVKALAMIGGAASGYIAKYIAKGIDDAGEVGATGHDDEIEGRMVRMDQGDLFGGGAARVQAWARAHGIRQFQAIGQPPVTVWRELRRVPEGQAMQASERVAAMWKAAQREGDKRASWALYMIRQGGAFCGREYRVAVQTEQRQVQGRYEDADKAKPVGVIDRMTGERAYCNRQEWRPRGAWIRKTVGNAGAAISGGHARNVELHSGATGAGCPPWTRVNNCTRQHGGTVAGVPVWKIKKQAGRLMTWAEVIRQRE